MIGKTIGNFRVTDRLGAGGMGEVFRARDTRLDRDVAIKVLPEGFAEDPERLARFEREAKLLAGLSDPHIGGIYGIEEVEGDTYLILEYVEGEDLAQRLERGPIAVDEGVEIARQVASALEVAHEQGIIHRDLKPANIMITPEGQAKVLDFGLAKAVESDGASSSADLSNSPTLMASSPTLAGVILGTAAYMSPEQARGGRVDKRTDIFGYGAVLWEMLTGQQLFTGATVSDTLAAVLRAEPDFDALQAKIPPALRRLLERCLEKDVKRRLRDIGEARIALEDVQSGKAHTGERDTEVSRPGFFSRYGGWIAAAVVAVVAVVLMERGGPAPNTTELPLRKSTITLSYDDPSIGEEFAPEISPDGRYVVYMSGQQVWLRDLTTADGHPIPGTEGAATPFWSPDGSEIGFGLGKTIQRIPREGGRATIVGTLPESIQLGGGANAAWGSDGRIVIGTGTAGLLVVAARGGAVSELLDPGENETDFHEVCALPDGNGWAFIIHRNDGIGNIDALTPAGERIALLRIEDQVRDLAWSTTGHIVFGRTGETRGLWALPVTLDPPAASGEPFLVASGGDAPSVSRDGTLVYSRGYQSGAGSLVLADRTGAVLQTVGQPVETSRPFPELSPDGGSILMAESFGDGRELYLHDIASGNRRRLTFNDLREDIARWHPNGRDIVFYESNDYGTYIMPLDGSSEAREVAQAIMATVTSDGKRLVGSRQRNDRWAWDIYLYPADGEGEPQPLIETGAVEWWAQLSPDEKYMAWMSNESGKDEVYLTTFPNPTNRWAVSSNGGAFPRWRGDGGEIYYVEDDRIMAVDVSLAGGVTLGVPRELFHRDRTFWSVRWPDGFDVSADGERFVFVVPERDETMGEPGIVVVQNWLSEFKD